MADIEIKNLSFSYPLASSAALSNVSFSVDSGRLCLICGSSGSGKSTLLRLLKKEIAPHGKKTGNVSVGGKIGFVGQDAENNIITDTVYGELAFGLQNTSLSRSETALKIAETASYFNLNKYINDKTAELSGGTKQMLALACAMTASPDVLLLDEPCSQLDPVAARNFYSAVLRLKSERGITILVADHRPDLLAACDSVLYLKNGSAAFFGSPEGLAEYLPANNDPMRQMLPSYTQILENHPLDYASAKRQLCNVAAKKAESNYDYPVALKTHGLAFAYKNGGEDVLFCLDYTAKKGCINAIVGANGSGKTTLLKCLCKILKPYGGRIKTDGKAAYMPQNVQALFLCDTVREEISDDALVREFGLEKLLDANPFDLSGGEAQRLAVAKIVQTGADILLLDEPTKSVDAAFKAELALILRKLCLGGKTVVLVTHDIEFAGRYADFASFLFDGKIAASAPRRQFFAALDIYTTSLSAMTGGRIVSIDDAEVSP